MKVLGPNDLIELSEERQKQLEKVVELINDSLSGSIVHTECEGHSAYKSFSLGKLRPEYKEWMFSLIEEIYQKSGWVQVTIRLDNIYFYSKH